MKKAIKIDKDTIDSKCSIIEVTEIQEDEVRDGNMRRDKIKEAVNWFYDEMEDEEVTNDKKQEVYGLAIVALLRQGSYKPYYLYTEYRCGICGCELNDDNNKECCSQCKNKIDWD